MTLHRPAPAPSATTRCTVPTAALWRLLVLGLSLLIAACANDPAVTLPPSGTGGSGGEPSVTLRFEPAELPVLEPERERELTVIASPPDRYLVRFTLLLDPAYATVTDASLSHSQASTDPETGSAKVTVRAPTSHARFTIRASIEGVASASITANVEKRGLADLEVTPVYKGRRSVELWTAEGRPMESCATLLTNPSTEPAVWSAESNLLPRLLEVPAGIPLAVTLRAGRYIYGCAQVEGLVAKTLNIVAVETQDVPLNVAETDLSVLLNVQETGAAWGQHLEESVKLSRAAFVGDTLNDIELLLGTMHDAIVRPEDRSEFERNRQEQAWDNLLLAALNWSDGAVLRNALSTWMLEGTVQLADRGRFGGQLHPAVERFQLTSAMGLDPATLGFVEESASLVWFAEPGDTVVMGTTLTWMPSQLVTALGETTATAASPTASSMLEALEELVSCDTLAAALIQAPAEASYGDCDVSCTKELCRNALNTRWERARGANVEPRSLHLTGTGHATVDDLARPKTFSGTWLASFVEGEGSVVGGPIQGEAIPSE